MSRKLLTMVAAVLLIGGSTPTVNAQEESTCLDAMVKDLSNERGPILILDDAQLDVPGHGACPDAEGGGVTIAGWTINVAHPTAVPGSTEAITVEGVIRQLTFSDLNVVSGAETITISSESPVHLIDIDADGVDITITAPEVTMSEVTAAIVDITADNADIADSELDELHLRDATATVEGVRIGQNKAPGLTLEGGAVTLKDMVFPTTKVTPITADGGDHIIEGATFAGTSEAVCMQVDGGTWTMRDISIPSGSCTAGVLHATAMDGVTLDGVNLVGEDTAPLVAVAGELHVHASSLVGGNPPLAMTGTGDWTVTDTLITEGAAPIDIAATRGMGVMTGSTWAPRTPDEGEAVSLFKAVGDPQSTLPQILFQNNAFGGIGTAFVADGPAAFDAVFEVRFHAATPTPLDPSVIGTTVPDGGNAWATYDGYDSDGDGLGDVPFIPSGLSSASTKPLVPINHAPAITAFTAQPDPQGRTVFVPGSTIDVSVQGVDADGETDLDARWLQGGDVIAEGDATQIVFDAPGIHTIRGELVDGQGAPSAADDAAFTVEVDPTNAAAKITAGPTVVDCATRTARDLDADPVFVGQTFCIIGAAADPDAADGPDFDRLDTLVFDIDADGIVGENDIRLSSAHSPTLPIGRVGFAADRTATWQPLACQPTVLSTTGPEILDVDCDGGFTRGDVRLTTSLDAPAHLPGSRARAGDLDLGADVVSTRPLRLAEGEGQLYLEDGDGVLGTGDLFWGDVSGFVPAGHSGTGASLTSLNGALGWVDREAEVTLQWTGAFPQETILPTRGPEATYAFATPGIASITLTAGDIGHQAAGEALTIQVPVLSDGVPLAQAQVSPSRAVHAGDPTIIEVFRGTTVTIADTSAPEAPAEITSRQWSIDGVPVGDGAISFEHTFAAGNEHELRLDVTSSNGQQASRVYVLDVVAAPPVATMEVSPMSFTADDLVTFTASGSLDVGMALDGAAPRGALYGHPMGTGVLARTAIFADSDGSGTLTAGDIPLQKVNGLYERGLVSATDLEIGFTGMPVAANTICHADLDGTGDLSGDDAVYLQVEECDLVPVDAIRLMAPAGGTWGSRVAAGDFDVGAPAATWADARFVRSSDGFWYLQQIPSDEVSPGDLRLPGVGASAIVGQVSDDGGTPVTVLDPSLVTPALDGVGVDVLRAGSDIAAGDLRLQSYTFQTPAFTPLSGLAGTPALGEPAAVCVADEDGDGALTSFGMGREPMFIDSHREAPGCDRTSEGDLRLQPDPFGRFEAFTRLTATAADIGIPTIPVSHQVVRAPTAYLDLAPFDTVNGYDIRLEAAAGQAAGSNVLPASQLQPGASRLQYEWTCIAGCLDDPFEGNTDARPVVRFDTSGAKTIRLTITDDDGNQVPLEDTYIVQNIAPTPAATYAPLAPTDLDVVTFDASGSLDRDGIPSATLSYLWTFPDGATSNGPVANHLFTESGMHVVRLLVTDADPLDPRSTEIAIDVNVLNVPPVAAATTQPALPLTGAAVVFDASPSYDLDGDVVDWRWYLLDSDGAIIPDSEIAGSPTVQRSFAEPGDYPFLLVVSDDDGAIGTLQSSVTIHNRAPVADIQATQDTLLPPAIVSFDGRGSSDPEGTPLSYAWDFGDGGTATAATAQHEFTTRGEYQVVLTVTDAHGATASTDLVIEVLNQAPRASIVMPGPGRVGQEMTFAAAASDPEDDALTHAWIFLLDAEEVATAAGETVAFTPGDAGRHTVVLETHDAQGDSITTSRQFQVASLPPTASLELSADELTIGQEVLATLGATDPDGQIVDRFIDFGDGTARFVSADSATHAYDAPGTYQVTFDAIDDDGDSDTVSKPVTVINPAPVVHAIHFQPETPRVGDLMLFTADITDDTPQALDLEWDFKDGVVALGSAPTHQYRVSGIFEVQVEVTDAFGAVTTLTVPVEVRATASSDKAEAPSNGSPDIDDADEAVQDARRVDKESPLFAWAGVAAILVALLVRRRS